MTHQPTDAGYRRRVGIIVGGIVVAAVAIVGAILWLTSGDSTDDLDSRITLSPQDQQDITQVTESFLQAVGNYGYDTEEIDGDNVFDLLPLGEQTQHESLSLLMNSRIDTYLAARESYILSGSPLYYSTRKVYEWSVPFETENIFKYTVQNIEPNVPDTANLIRFEGESRRSVVVPVTYDAHQVRIYRGSTDADWDGTHPVAERHLPSITADITLIEVDQEWHVYNMRNVDHEYLLATWQHATWENYDATMYQGFQQTDVLEPSEPFDFDAWVESWQGETK